MPYQANRSAGVDMTADDVKEARASQDFEKLKGLLSNLVGQPCLRAGFSYGEELEIHFGEPTSYRHPKLSEKTRGSWVLETLATPWMLFPDPKKGLAYTFGLLRPPLFPAAPVSKKELEQVMANLAGARVDAVQLDGGDLSIQFSNGYVWYLLPRYAPPDLNLPAWELMTPYRAFIQFWGEPASVWSYLRSDVRQTT
jgi:hypothetical protein